MSSSAIRTQSSGVTLGRSLCELVVALLAAAATGLCLALMSGLAFKYQVAAVVGALITGAILMRRDRRLLLVLMWLFVMPLGLEKVVDSGLSVAPEFLTQYVVFNAADVLLILLAAVLLVEWHQTGVCPLKWSSLATLWSMILLWSFVSFAIHAVYLHDGFVHVAPLSLLTGVRTLIFLVLLQSSIRDRGEMIAVMIALGVGLLMQSLIVAASYATGDIYTLARLTGGATLKLKSFSGGDGNTVVRANGTVGDTNQQAIYHAFCTLPLVAFFALRNAGFRNVALGIICLSMLAIILTFSRGAWLASIIAIFQAACVFAWRRKISSAAWMKGAAIAIAGCVVIGAFSGPIMLRLTRGGDDGATDSRLRMFSLAFDLFRTHPIIGVGPGEYVEAGYHLEPTNYRHSEWLPPGGSATLPPVGRLEVAQALASNGQFVTVPLPVHNRYLLSLSEIGVPGLVLWLSLLWVFVRCAWQCSYSKDPFYCFLGIAGAGVVSGLLVYLNSDLFADDKSLQLLFLIPLLLSIAERHAAMTEARDNPSALESEQIAPNDDQAILAV